MKSNVHVLFSLRSSAVLLASACLAGNALAFDSGSTGADGAYSPTVSAPLLLPDSGVLNFTSINIPSGVTITLTRNRSNTPATILVSGNATIAGALQLSGGRGADAGTAGSGNQGDDGNPGTAGAGGFDGGRGGKLSSSGGNGLGPGGGGASSSVNIYFCGYTASGGAGGGYAVKGSDFFTANNITPPWCGISVSPTIGGPAYGSSLLVPLIGGSGGGGGAGNTTFEGSGGGGGGGALLLAVSGNLSLTGNIIADGGAAGNVSGVNSGTAGGGGSGGALRLVATTVAGTGGLYARGGAGGTQSPNGGTWNGFVGSAGRIRIEGGTITFSGPSDPAATRTTPGALFASGLPALRISKIAGVDVPLSPTGTADVTLPANTVNPVSIEFAASNVPLGNIIKLTVTPASGAPTSAISPALTGTLDNASASVQATLPVGASSLQATVTYTVVASLGDALSRFAANERVEQLRVAAEPGRASTYKLITASGREFDAPADALRLALLGAVSLN